MTSRRRKYRRKRTKKKRRRTKKKRRRRRKRKRKTRRKRGGVGNGNKCIKDNKSGRLRGPNSECRDPPGNGHNQCYYSYSGNDCKGIKDKYGEDKHCVKGQCV